MTSPIGASFKVEKGLDYTTAIQVDKPLTIAGHSEAVDLRIEHQFVSRRHFQIRFDADVFYISDLGSTNGTCLNGMRLVPQEEHVLRNGDSVGLAGDRVLLTFSEPRSTIRIDSTAISSLIGLQSDTPIRIDSASREVWVRGNKIPPLPKKEFDILECLFQNRGRVVSRDEVAAAGWPERPYDVPNVDIDQYISRLRRKVEEVPSDPKLIVTRLGYGYMIP